MMNLCLLFSFDLRNYYILQPGLGKSACYCSLEGEPPPHALATFFLSEHTTNIIGVSRGGWRDDQVEPFLSLGIREGNLLAIAHSSYLVSFRAEAPTVGWLLDSGLFFYLYCNSYVV